MNRIARSAVLLLASTAATGAVAQAAAPTPPRAAAASAGHEAASKDGATRTAAAHAAAAPGVPGAQGVPPASGSRGTPAGVPSPDGPGTGDAWVDGRLVDIGAYAATYRDAFVDEVVRYGRAPRELVQALLARPDWRPGDVYVACAIAVQAGRPCREVVSLRDVDPAQGWGAIAARLGVAAGTPRFHALKRAIVASYDRWARPIVLDDELSADFPGRPHAPPSRAASSTPHSR